MNRSLVPLAAFATATAPALGQTFDGRIAFRADHTFSTAPTISNGGVHEVDTTGLAAGHVLNFSVMFGNFTPGNEGLLAWRGVVGAAGTGVGMGNTPGNRAPFTFSPEGSGDPIAPNSYFVQPVRNPESSTLWIYDDPHHNPPNWTQGRNAYFTTFRFTVTLNDLADRDILISADGVMTGVENFTLLWIEGGGTLHWTVGAVHTGDANGAFTLRLVPAPGASALLCGGCLLALRRRRPTPPSPSPRIG